MVRRSNFRRGRPARNCDPRSEMIPGKLFTTLDLPYNRAAGRSRLNASGFPAEQGTRNAAGCGQRLTARPCL